MTDNNHPITPPPELVDKLASGPGFWTERLVRAFQAGADFELQACVEWLINEGHEYEHVALQNDRRPKPPTLKEQALQALYRFDDTEGHEGLTPEQIAEDFVLIRRAIESLPD